jgi:hypothetical protein
MLLFLNGFAKTNRAGAKNNYDVKRLNFIWNTETSIGYTPSYVSVSHRRVGGGIILRYKQPPLWGWLIAH